MKSLGLTLALLLFAGVVAEGQILKRLGKRVKRKVEERVERKTDEAVDKGLDKVEDAAEGKDGEKEGPGAAGDDQSGKDGKNAGLETAKDTGNTAAAVGLSVQQNPGVKVQIIGHTDRSEEHTSEHQSLMSNSYAV